MLAIPVADLVSPAPAPPGIQSTAGFPVTVGGAFGVLFSTFSNVGGITVDDDGSIYFHQADLIGLTGGNIIKVTDVGTDRDRSAATNGLLTVTTLNPAGGLYGTTQGPPTQVNRFTNYSGTSTTFGNIVAMATGQGNSLYAAVARSRVATDDAQTQATEGPFTNPAALGATPSMIISFSDASGAFEACSTPGSPVVGALPIGNGIADVGQASQALTAGVNNFRVFALGNGPNIRSAGSAIVATPTNTLPNQDLQIDFSVYSGLVVDEEGTVYVVSGGTPAQVGSNPSPNRGEVLAYVDSQPKDRRADYIDLRGDAPPNPPASGGNVGDGDSDRFDHIFWQAPVDANITPLGIAGLARGFLRYTNRLVPNPISPGLTLGQTAGQMVQGDDDTTAMPIIFENLDPSHQTAGGDDQNTPFRGDDDNGAGTPALVGPLNGGVEFNFGGPVGTAGAIWNGFFLNSNGNISFNTGDTSNNANVPDFRTGPAKIASAWMDVNPSARAVSLNNFPVQALGFSGVNAFKVRWINVPEFGGETCGSDNTFAITLYDDGTGIDENANQPLNPANPIGNNAVPFDLQEGPNDLRWTREPNTQVLVPASPRRSGTGYFCLEYGRMDLLGVAANPVLVGYSIGGLGASNPPGLCETNLGAEAIAADASVFNRGLIGSGTEPTLYELFDGGTAPVSPNNAGVPDYDLRFEGNDPALSTPATQPHPNRGNLCFFGVAAAPPPIPLINSVTPTNPLALPPGQLGLVNSMCEVQLDIVGSGFYENLVTTVSPNGGESSPRPGKTVTTAATLAFDADGNGSPEVTLALVNVTPISTNLVRATVAKFVSPLGTAFPLAVLGGGNTVLTLTTTQSSGDNNIFGPFTRTAATSVFESGVVPVGVRKRAPIVLNATPASGDGIVQQTLTLTGVAFKDVLGVDVVTSVFAVEQGNPGNVIQATSFLLPSATQLTAVFNFGPANAGKTFLIFASGPNGTSRNLTVAPAGTPAGCVLGNEEGNLVTFTTDPLPCVYGISPTSQSFAAVGGSSTVAITTGASCAWNAVSNASFIQVTSGAAGSGNGVVGYSVAANLGPARSGTMTIAGQVFTVTQASGCTFTINPTSQGFAAAGGSSVVTVTATDSACSWTAVSNDAWITITAGTAGTGNSSTSYAVAANVGPARTGTLTIGGQTHTVTQASGCTFSISPTSQNYAAAGGTGAVNVSASAAGGPWTAVSNDAWITVTSGASGTGNGAVNYSVAANVGPARTGTITVAGQTHTVTQAAGCTFAITPTSQTFSAMSGTGTVAVTTVAGCAWTATSNAAWLTITSGTSGTGNGTVTYTVAALGTGLTRVGTLTIAGQTFTVTQTKTVKADFDGDGKTDLSVWRQNIGTWLTINSSNGALQTQLWGPGTPPLDEVIVPGDYDGDGKTDHAVWRNQTGIWLIRKSSDGQTITQTWGSSQSPYFAVATPGDFDGDGKTDIAVWRPVDGNFYILKSSDGSFAIEAWGTNGDIPVAADYDGDGKCDVAIWRPGNGIWYIKNSSGGIQTIPWGAGYAPYFDVPVPADYDGDGKTDLAIWRGQDSLWYIRKSSNGQPVIQQWGANYAPYFDVPVPGDYDGDGKADVAVWRPTTGTWYVIRSSNASFLIQNHGQSGDVPVPSRGVR